MILYDSKKLLGIIYEFSETIQQLFFIFVFAASVFFFTILSSGSSRYSRHYRPTKKVSSECRLFHLKPYVIAIHFFIGISSQDSVLFKALF